MPHKNKQLRRKDLHVLFYTYLKTIDRGNVFEVKKVRKIIPIMIFIEIIYMNFIIAGEPGPSPIYGTAIRFGGGGVCE